MLFGPKSQGLTTCGSPAAAAHDIAWPHIRRQVQPRLGGRSEILLSLVTGASDTEPAVERIIEGTPP
jgi:hypothetical protein